MRPNGPGASGLSGTVLLWFAAGTGVLGTAFAAHGYYPVATVLLGLAALSWALLLTAVLRHRETPVAGVSFLLSAGHLGASLRQDHQGG